MRTPWRPAAPPLPAPGVPACVTRASSLRQSHPWQQQARALAMPRWAITAQVVIMERGTNRPRGFGFVTFKEEARARAATAEEHIIMGRKARTAGPARPQHSAASPPAGLRVRRPSRQRRANADPARAAGRVGGAGAEERWRDPPRSGRGAARRAALRACRSTSRSPCPRRSSRGPRRCLWAAWLPGPPQVRRGAAAPRRAPRSATGRGAPRRARPCGSRTG